MVEPPGPPDDGVAALAGAARARVGEAAWNYLAGGSGDNHTQRRNVEAWAELLLSPRRGRRCSGRVPVLVDGGIRRGTDIVKALSLGAAAVLVGRPVIWGLTLGGATGVRGVLDTLRGELAAGMAMAGAATLAELTPDLLWR